MQFLQLFVGCLCLSILPQAKNCIGNDESLPKIDLSGHSTRRTYATVDSTYPECIVQGHCKIMK